MVPFAGWDMPVQYTGIVDEHKAVRQSVGVFDISHMGQFIVSGPGAEAFLNRVLTNNISKLQPGQGYTTKVGQRHRLVGVTDCDILEVSTPELGTTWRLEDDYARPHETPEQRVLERQS